MLAAYHRVVYSAAIEYIDRRGYAQVKKYPEGDKVIILGIYIYALIALAAIVYFVVWFFRQGPGPGSRRYVPMKRVEWFRSYCLRNAVEPDPEPESEGPEVVEAWFHLTDANGRARSGPAVRQDSDVNCW